VGSARVELGGLGAELVLEHAAGESRVRLGHSVKDRVTTLLESVVAVASPTPEPPPALEAPPALASPPELEAPPAADVDDELALQRSRFLGVLRGAHAAASGRVSLLGMLGARQSERVDALRKRHARRERERAESEQRAVARVQRARKEQAQFERDVERRAREDAEEMRERAARHAAERAARKAVSKAASKASKRGGAGRVLAAAAPELEARVGEAWMPPPAARAESKRSVLPWVVLLLLVLAGTLPALDKLLSSP
jgi:hypothetical protein